jgi:hypothetical protein
MTRGFELVVSAENNPYMAWQALVFHYTCTRHIGAAPIVVVHGDDNELDPLYQCLIDHGGRIQRAPTYRDSGRFSYPPRNTPATLAHVRVDPRTKYLVLCDPDLVLLRPWPLVAISLEPDEVSLDGVSYLMPDDETRPALAAAYAAHGVELAETERKPVPGGVPHIIPVAQQEALSREWLRLVDSLLTKLVSDPTMVFASLASMWALDLAIRRLRLRPVVTRYAISNFLGDQPLPRSPGSEAILLHYCYGDASFDKRNYMSAEQVRDVWHVRAEPGSVHEALCAEIRAAGSYYGLDRS